MSDYKRFVAYLYEYHGNTKGENRGFVRVEARNGSCQMGFQLKVISLPERTPLNVCGFVRIRDVLFGIPIGILRSGKNGISGRLLAPAVHMGDTAFSLKDLSGLLIRGPEGKIYATQWDDIPIDPGRFTTDPSVLQDPAPAESADETGSEIPPAFPATEAAAADTSETVRIASTEKIPDEKEALQSDPVPEPESRETEAGKDGPSLPLPGAGSQEERWEILFSRFPHIRPFDDDEISDCVRLDLKDLPELRKAGWLISSNQFLLHGFYSYRHFLMGRSSSLGNVIILGVPGIFDIREQFMAGMFGFSGFKPARNQTGASGNTPFGYWYRQVQ